MIDRTRRACLHRLVAGTLVLTSLSILRFARAGAPPVLKKTDRCPVCGMFVYKYPKWVAQSVFRDGTAYFYDGAKDMFKHWFDVGKYTPGKSAENIVELYVTDYYEVELIPARTAFYVLGSNVLGPMGHELLPFTDLESAQEFLEDHRGKSIVRFPEVTADLVQSLDRRS